MGIFRGLFQGVFQATSPKRRAVVLGLALSGGLGLGGGTIVPALLHPPAAHAYVSRLAVSLNHATGETYETLLRRAENVARAAAQRSFDNDILVGQVSIMITANNKGVEVPILSLEISRFQWRSQPDPRRWATYYPGSRAMLGLGRSGTGPATTPIGPSRTPTPVPTRAPAPMTAPTPVPVPRQPLPPPGRTPGQPTAQPTGTPTGTPTVRPTGTPTAQPTATPTQPTRPRVFPSPGQPLPPPTVF